jgi:hypothetical protein
MDELAKQCGHDHRGVLTRAFDALAGLFAGVNGFAVASTVINNCLFLLSVVLLAK